MNDIEMLNLFKHSYEIYNNMTESLCKKASICNSALNILLLISQDNGNVYAKDLVWMLGLKPNMVSLHINNLVNQGYLKREMIKQDRRKVRLVCTAKSKKIVQDATKIANNLMEQLFEGLNDEEVEVYTKSINLFKQNMNNIKNSLSTVSN